MIQARGETLGNSYYIGFCAGQRIICSDEFAAPSTCRPRPGAANTHDNKVLTSRQIHWGIAL